MDAISNVRAGVACLPLVGPLVSLCNVFEVTKELYTNPVTDGITTIRTAATGIQGFFAFFSGNQAGVASATQGSESQRNKEKSRLLSNEKGRIYSICGIVGNVLTVVTLVVFVYLRIFSPASAIILITTCTFIGLVLSHQLYLHNQTLTQAHHRAQV